MELVYVRTDRNGTKIYHDWTCPRCGGAGESDKWYATGRICYGCGGTGKRAKPAIVKEYTPEYSAKLEARRDAKSAKKAEEVAKWFDEHAEEIERAERKVLALRYAEQGCGADGVGYVLTGNTYQIRDQIKRAHGKWIYGVWVCPVAIEGKGVTARRIDLSGHIGSGSEYWLDGFDFYEAIHG